MRKSGLQKQIAFIFDDVPMPQTDAASRRLPLEAQAGGPVKPAGLTPQASASQPTIPTAAAAKAAAPQPAAPATAAPAQHVPAPAVPGVRPKPLPRQHITRPKVKPRQVLAKQFKKALFGASGGQMDPRQKKMTILVGALALVFAGVLTMTMSGLGQKSETAAGTDEATAAVKPRPAQPLEEWKVPEPLPTELRDPMYPAKKQPSAGDDGSGTLEGPLVVRGIVFSQTNPSAIINGHIVRQGQVLDGIEIIKINRDSVEFKQQDRQWTQPVQH